MKSIVISLLFSLLLASGSALAGDIDAGKAKSVTCVACHGPEGMSSNPLWPHLAGQQEQYLAKQLRDFRAGTRKDPVMGPMAAPLSDEDIDNLAAYYASLK